MGKSKDITGQRFGRLTVFRDSGKRDKGKNIIWVCHCDCGNECEVITANLNSHATKSCGCLKKETEMVRAKQMIASEKRKKHIGLDTREKGTRITSISHARKDNKNNNSGTKGVCFHKKSGMWMAYIMFKNKQKYLGLFKNKQDAINARKEAEEKYFKPILEKYGKTQ